MAEILTEEQAKARLAAHRRKVKDAYLSGKTVVESLFGRKVELRPRSAYDPSPWLDDAGIRYNSRECHVKEKDR